jgi:hypothetical protein
MQRKPVSVAQMRAHIGQLCRSNSVGLLYDTRPSASREDREVWIRPVRSDRAYASALHELGHVLGGYQRSRVELTRERWAWAWARSNALCWTPAMKRHAKRCLESYAQH